MSKIPEKNIFSNDGTFIDRFKLLREQNQSLEMHQARKALCLKEDFEERLNKRMGRSK